MKKSLWIIAVIAVVNALGYGIVIPVLYSYSRSFGLTDFQNGLLFSIFSVGQFIATPLIGRLSDVYGRKLPLLGSVLGTAASFFLMAAAPNAAFLFLARALDGITAGNIPVALAVISDTTQPGSRAKWFGIIGASFGFGFTFGPAISAFTLRYGAHVPFLIAGAIALVACVLIVCLLPETNKNRGKVISRRLWDFHKLWRALFDPRIGAVLAVSFLVMVAFSLYIYAFQPFAVVVLGLSAARISSLFTGIGIIGLVSQSVLIPRVVKRFGERRVLMGALLLSTVMYAAISSMRSTLPFVIAVSIQAFANGFPMPIIQSLLSRETDETSQGTIMGINASYQSIGQILGPIIGGASATVSIPLPFLIASLVVFAGFLTAASGRLRKGAAA